MEYRELKPDNLYEASSLVWVIFSEFVAPGYSQVGIETFRKFIQPEELEKSLGSGRFFIMGCFDREKLVGVVLMRDFCHVSLLFVDKAYHRRGIAKKLFTKAMKRCTQENPKLVEITVNSSLYAVEIYRRLGFEIEGNETTKDGITFVPMKMNIGLRLDKMNEFSSVFGSAVNSTETYRKFALYYDAYVRDFKKDIPLYLNFVREGENVLEVGCGTGRILKQLLDAGCYVTGVDISPDMLFIAREKLAKYISAGKLRILKHNLCIETIPEKFERAFVTFYTFNYLVSQCERERFMHNIYDILEPSGIIIIDLLYPIVFSNPELDNKWTEKMLLINGYQIKLKDKRTMNGDIEERIQKYTDGNTVDEIITHRSFFTKSYIQEVLLKAGFKDIRFTDGYNIRGFHSLDSGEKEINSFIVIAVK